MVERQKIIIIIIEPHIELWGPKARARIYCDNNNISVGEAVKYTRCTPYSVSVNEHAYQSPAIGSRQPLRDSISTQYIVMSASMKLRAYRGGLRLDGERLRLRRKKLC